MSLFAHPWFHALAYNAYINTSFWIPISPETRVHIKSGKLESGYEVASVSLGFELVNWNQFASTLPKDWYGFLPIWTYDSKKQSFKQSKKVAASSTVVNKQLHTLRDELTTTLPTFGKISTQRIGIRENVAFNQLFRVLLIVVQISG